MHRSTFPSRQATLLAVCIAAGLATPRAQWSSLPSVNLEVASGPVAQHTPKVATSPFGGCYVAWFASDPNGAPPFGHDVRLQRYDGRGNALWAPGGLLVADRGFGNADYGYLDLVVDPAGNAALTFLDDRTGAATLAVTKIDPSGATRWLWRSAVIVNPQYVLQSIVATSDGATVVAWSLLSDLRLQRLDPQGVPQWAPEIQLFPHALRSLAAADAGGVIFSTVPLLGRQLRVWKLGADGTQRWGPTGLVIDDAGPAPPLDAVSSAADGAGGAVFSWATRLPLGFDGRVQHVDGAGVERFPHNGVPLSTDATKWRMDSAVMFEPATQETTVVAEEWIALGTATPSGVMAQRFDAVGNPLFGPTGTQVAPLHAAENRQLTALQLRDGSTMPVWIDRQNFGPVRIHAARVLRTGALAAPPFEVSSATPDKWHLSAAVDRSGVPIVVWEDYRAGDADVLAQDIVPSSATLGGLATATLRYGFGFNPVVHFSSLPSIGDTWHRSVEHGPAATATGTMLALLPRSPLWWPHLGEVLIELGLPLLHTSIVASAGAGVDFHSLPVPPDANLIGLQLSSQGIVFTGTVLQLTNAVDVTIGL